MVEGRLRPAANAARPTGRREMAERVESIERVRLALPVLVLVLVMVVVAAVVVFVVIEWVVTRACCRCSAGGRPSGG